MTSKNIRIDAPAGMDLLDVAQHICGPHVLLKAEPLRYSERTFQHYRAMAESSALFEAAYRAQLEKLHIAIMGYVDAAAKPRLAKSSARQPYEPLATPTDLSLIRRLIGDYHLAFIAAQLGPGYVAVADVQRLIDAGILPPGLGGITGGEDSARVANAAQAITIAYNYGIAMGRNPRLRRQAGTLTLNDFMAAYPPPGPPLSRQEESARGFANRHAAECIVGLGNTVADDFSTLVVEGDAELQRAYAADIREELDINLERQQSWRKLASELGHRTKDWARNFKRIAATEKQHAMQEGLAAGLIEREGDPDEVMVSKQPSDGACPDCIRLHLTGGPGSTPRIFPLSVLRGNGTNVGRKRSAWKPIVGPIHPWCACELIHVPPGWGWDEDGNLTPLSLRRSDLLGPDLRKSTVSYAGIVPDRGVAIRISDPQKYVIALKVVDRTPPEVFDKRVGVTLICEDEPRVGNSLDPHDLAYWTGNEIRVSGGVPAEKLTFVLQHELGHSLNVYLMYRWGGEKPVRAWHNKLYRVSVREGFVTAYAATNPIENAAELTRLYLYERPRLVANYPKAFAVLDAAYREIWRPRERIEPTGEPAKQRQDARDERARGGARF